MCSLFSVIAGYHKILVFLGLKYIDILIILIHCIGIGYSLTQSIYHHWKINQEMLKCDRTKEEFVPGLLLLPLSRDKGTMGQGNIFVPGQKDNRTSRPLETLIWKVPCKIYPDFFRVLAWFFSDLQSQLLCKPFQLAFKGQIHCQRWR